MASTFAVERLKLDGLDLNVPSDTAQVTNLVTNPSFEVDAAGWVDNIVFLQNPAGTTFVRGVPTPEQHGSYALIVDCTGATDQGVATAVSLTGGTTYYVRVRLAVGLGGPIKIAIGRQTSPFTEHVLTTSAIGGWVEYSLVFTPAVTDTYYLYARITNTATAHFHIDGAMVVAASSAVPYFDGDTPGYKWSGTSHASTSVPAPRISLEAFQFSPAKKLLEWIRSANANGQKLLRPPVHDNAEFDLRLRVRNSSMNLTLDTLGSIVDKVQEAERDSANGGRGLPLVWTPNDSTYSYTFYVLAGESPDIPKALDGADIGWLGPGPNKKPVINLKLICSPFGYGAEVTTSTTTSSLPLITATIADVPGDVSAEARAIVTDAAGQNRDFVVFGLEQYFYNAGSPPALLTDSDSFVTTGYAGSQTTRTGAYDADATGNNVVRATLSTTPVAVCSSLELAHKGSFRNYFRLWPSSTTISVRLAWRQGRDQWTTEPWVQASLEDNWWEVDLGQSQIRELPLGTQTWQWRIEAKSTLPGETIDVDFHALVPNAEAYQKARRTSPYETPITFLARDEFAQSAGALTGKTLPVGGTWAGAGDADDFQVEASGKTAQRTAVSDTGSAGRFGLAGTATAAAIVVQTDVKWSTKVDAAFGVLARYVDANNWVRASVAPHPTSGGASILVAKYVASSISAVIPSTTVTDVEPNTFYTIRLVIDAGGRAAMWYYRAGGSPGEPLRGSDPALATGGALASGRFGLYDESASATAVTRNYDNFMAFVPTDDAVIFANQSLEFRSHGDDPALREDSTGTYWGRPAEVRGGRFWLPPAGTDDRTTRIAVMARRNDIEILPSDNIADSTSVQVAYRPRWLVLPRQA